LKPGANGLHSIWEAEIGRVMFQGQPRQTLHETPSPK
jgi:hypothetical protein